MKKIRVYYTFLFLLFVLSQPSFSQTEFTLSIKTEAGKLMELLGNKVDSVTSLTLEGQINGNDVATIRAMKNLTSINMESVAIVAGGRFILNNGLELQTNQNELPQYMFCNLTKIKKIILPTKITQIGRNAFENSGIDSIQIPNSVSAINFYAFSNCKNLTSVVLPDGLKYIDFSVFSDCTALKTISIPETVEIIFEAAFINCSALTSVTIPKSVNSIRNSSFIGCSKLKEFIVSENNTKYCSLDGVLFNYNMTELITYPAAKSNVYFVPDGVFTIKDYSFSNCKELTTIYIPNSVSNIMSNAFSNCISLREIHVVSKTPPILGTDVFKNVNMNDSKLYIPIETAAIYRNTNVWNQFGNTIEEQSVVISEIKAELTVTAGSLRDSLLSRKNITTDLSLRGEINGDDIATIRSMPKLLSLDLSDVNIVDGGKFIGEYAYTIVPEKDKIPPYMLSGIKNITSIRIPESVVEIGDSAFYNCTGLNTFMVTNKVTTIGEGAFLSASNINSFEISENVTNIHSTAFIQCSALQQFIVSENNNSYCGVDGVLYSKNRTTLVSFPNSKSSSYIIPAYVTSIGANAFRSCSNLTYIEIPNSVESIGNYAFVKCTGLTNLSIPNKVKDINDYTFNSCTNLKTIHVPSNIRYIGKYAFALCTSLESFITPDSTITIADGAFYCCTSLQSIQFPEKVTSIGAAAFYRCSGIKSILLTKSILNIGQQVFSDCSNISEFEVAEGNQAFSSEDGVLFNKDKSVLICYPISGPRYYSIPTSVDSIGHSAFSFCTELDSVHIPNGVKSIGDYSFWYCPSLTKFEIPNSVSSLGFSALVKFTNLKQFISKADVPPTTNNSIAFERKDCILYIPKGSLDAYLKAEEWKDFGTIVECTYSYSVNATSSVGGRIEGLMSSVNQGETLTIRMIPDDGFKIDKVNINGKDITAEIINNSYELPPVYEDVSISVMFKGIETGITSPGKTTIGIYAENGSVFISGAKLGEKVFVHNIGGLLIYSGNIENEIERINLSSNQIYLITIGNKSTKVKL